MGAFIGRVSELRSIADLFERGDRLVTIWGVGGIGKTRIAREWIERKPSPRWVIELSDASGLEGLCAAVAARLDVPFTGATREVDIVAQLGRSLRARGPAVMLLDNFDTLVSTSAAALARWLEEAPALHILVTSRERLRLTEEAALELLPLPLERADDADCDAVRLLVTRVRELGGAALDPSDPRVVRLASALEGIPLALELAAARLEMLGIDAVLSRLPNRLGLLARGARGTRERQATMRGAIAWSWDLLTEAERRALCHFAIFRGGFTVDAAAHILGEDPMDVLGQLRDKSMLYARAVLDEGEPPRFSLYEVVREFGLERFGDHHADADQALRRHDAYFATLASGLAEKIRLAGDVEALALLTAELENLLEVHARALSVAGTASGEPQVSAAERAGVLLVAADAAMVSRTPAHVRLKLWDDTWRAVSQAPCSVETTISVLAGLGRAHLAAGDRKESSRILEAARSLAKKSKLDAPLVGVLLDLGVTLHALGQLELARTAYEDALARLRGTKAQHGPKTLRRQEARAHGNLGALFHDLRDFSQACVHYETAIALAASIGDSRIEGIMLGNLAVLAQEQGRHAAAHNGLERAIHLLSRAKDRRLRAIACGNLGMLAMETGLLEEAAIRLNEAQEALSLIGDRRSEGLAILRLGILAALGQDVSTARTKLEEARSIFARTDDLDGIGLVKLGEAFVGVGRPGYSTELAADALADANRSEDQPSLIARSDDARTIARLLARMLERLERGGPIEAEPATDALVVTRDLSMFRAPGATDWTRIDDHAAAALILGHLVALRRNDSSKCATVFELASAGWPNSKIHPSSAQNRVYVAIAWLRKAGLRSWLLRTPEGYRLDPEVRIERVTSPRPKD